MLILAMGLTVAADTIKIRAVEKVPAAASRGDTASLGPPSVRMPGGGLVWLIQDSTAVILRTWLPDSTPSWNDRLILSLDTNGDRAHSPQHDDFQWEFHRVLDSTVIFRGRDGRWQPPRDDPDWRLGPEREGGGWKVRAEEGAGGWSLLVEFDPEFFTQSAERRPGLSVAMYDEGSRRWMTWPAVAPGRQPAALGDQPDRWGIVLP